MQCLLLNALSALITFSDDHRFYQLYYPASLWLVVNWRMGSMFLLDIVSLLTGSPSISIPTLRLISVSMWSVPVCQIAWQRSFWFKVFLFDRGCNCMSSALHVMNEGVDSQFISIWLSVLVRVSFFITLFWFIRFCRSPRLCWSMARFGTFY